MANLPEQPTYDAGVYQLETTDPVQGHDSVSGNLGVSNQPLLNLANRTGYLKQTLDSVLDGAVIPPTVAPLDSPGFTGSPTAPTPALGDNSTRLATTAFVQGTVNGIATINVAGSTNVTLTPVQAGAGILQLTGVLTGLVSVIVPSISGQWTIWNQTGGAYALTVRTAAGTGVIVKQGGTSQVFCDGTNVSLSQTDYTNIQLSGVPQVVNPITAGDSTSRVASTAFVQNAVGGMTVKAVSAGNVLLSPADAGVGQIILNGTLTAPVNVIWPTGELGNWVVANKTTGPFSVTLSTATTSGADVILPQGQSVVVYSDGTNMVLAGSAASSSFTQYSFTATAGQKTFSAPYTPGNIVTFVNGASQAPSDITATDGANVTLTGYNGGNGAFAGDDVELIAFNSFTVANAITTSGGTLSGPLALTGGGTGVTPVQFDASTNLATTAFVQRMGLQSSGFNIVTASQTLGASMIGGTVQATGTTAPIAITLPLTSAVEFGSRIEFINSSGFAMTLGPQGASDKVFNINASPGPIVLQPGDFVTLECQSTSIWIAVNGGSGQLAFSSQLGANVAANGYQKLPSGLIIQWGSYGTNGTQTPTPTSFPIAFPNACFAVSLASVSGALVYGTFDSLTATVTKTSFSAVGVQSGAAGTNLSAHGGYFVATGW